MKLLGLIGYPLGHSFSEKYFNEKFQKENMSGFSYKNFPISTIKRFTDLLEEFPELNGLNVTIPYKEKIIPYLHKLDRVAEIIGAVNTVKFTNEGDNQVLVGYNTDVIGFTSSLKTVIKPGIRSALVLGTGGASKAVVYSLHQLGIKVTSVSRKKSESAISYNELTETLIAENTLIVNTTPLGTYPEVKSFPDIPYDFLGKNHVLFDLVYNPAETVFLQKGKEQGATILNGYSMLVAQAEASWKIWND